ncbi:hypothetical protein [Streptomyces cyaneofuscatus]|uniref:hypothetical protein n=1 Tax=Streptomyces cyaneofuscatus TaxID=66883 RepID=UPI0036817929
MGDTDVTNTVLAVAGVATCALIVAKGLIDQLPDVFHSIGQARKAWKQLANDSGEAPQAEDTEEHPPPLAPPADDKEPPLAA